MPASTARSYKAYALEYVHYADVRGLIAEEPATLASFMRYCATERPRKLARSTVANLIPAANHHFLYSLGRTGFILGKESPEDVGPSHARSNKGVSRSPSRCSTWATSRH